MKKIISIILPLTLIFSIIPFGVYANGNGGSGEIDISDYTNSELDFRNKLLFLFTQTRGDIVNECV